MAGDRIGPAGIEERRKIHLLEPDAMRDHQGGQRHDCRPWRRRTQEQHPRRMDQRGEADRADHRHHPVFRHQRQRAGRTQQDARAQRSLVEGVQIGQHQQRQRHQLQQIGIVFEALEIEDRIERQHYHHEKGAAAIDHAQGDLPADHHADADRGHRQTIGRPVGRRKHVEPGAGDPARQRRMLAVAQQQLLAPGIALGDVEMHVLRGLQLGQDRGPQHAMRQREAGDQPGA